MGELLGVGLSHYPGFMYADDQMSMRVKVVLQSEKIPAELKDPANWPAEMRQEWADDEGTGFAAEHRRKFVESVLKIRDTIDEFRPDAVVIFGDDQYENFQEDIIPTFGVYIRDEFVSQPFLRGRAGVQLPTVWNDPLDTVVRTPGAVELARDLTRSLIESDFDVAYSYRGLHLSGLGHAYNNTLAYLDYDRRGWDYPIVPIHINSYGSQVIRNQGGHASLFTADEPALDPPAPSPRRAFAFGEAVARYVLESDHRVVVIGSSSWSHAFLTAKNHYLYPDLETDRARFEELRSGNFTAWRDLSLRQVEDAGQTELLNWLPLVGAMHYARAGAPLLCELNASLLMNSSKCSAIFQAMSARGVPAAKTAAVAG